MYAVTILMNSQADLYVRSCFIYLDNVKEESTFFTYLFPHKPDNTDNADFESNRDESCCYTEATASRCSLEFCDCNVEDQIKCYINGSNLNRFKLFYIVTT